ncbi:MAG: hypothetical protein ACXWQO_15105 [Bdellovibrionota bacterium]
MDYLKYALTTVSILVLLLIEMHFTGSAGLGYALLGIAIALLFYKKRVSYALGLTLLASWVYIWSFYMVNVAHRGQIMRPDVYTPENIPGIMGLGMFLALIVLHPISYFAGRLLVAAFKKQRAMAR